MSPLSEYHLPISGMTCASCAGRVERALGKLPGVHSVSVNLANEQARVVMQGAADRQQLAELLAAIRQAGYGVPLRSLELSISGMTCASCVGRVERALGKLPEVQSISVNLATERAYLQLVDGLPEAQLIAALDKAGYQAQVLQQGADEQPQLRHLRRERYAVLAAVLLALPLLLPMLGAPLGWHWMLPAWAQFLLATPVQFLLGGRFYRAAWKALRSGNGNMDLLVALGTSAAYGLSLYLWYQAAPGQPAQLYFESSAVLISLILLGKYLESRAKRQTGDAIRALQALRPEQACRLHEGVETWVPVSALQLGDQLLVRPGERFPADAEVLLGFSHADEALITGESLPVARRPGDRVTGGAINGEGLLQVRVSALGRESVLARIIRLVEDAQAGKAPIQQLVDRVSRVFVPLVVLVAVLTLLTWLSLGATWEAALLNSVAVLVIACPCALGLATPTAIMVGTGVAARQGILIKDASVLELAQNIDLLAFDKTGTLTLGQPRLLQLAADDEIQAISLAGALQRGSEHPLARAVAAACQARGLLPETAEDIQVLPGCGIQGWVAGRHLQLGNSRLLDDLPAPQAAFSAAAASWEAQGYTLSWLVEREPQPKVMALLAFADQLKEGAAEAIAELHRQGIPCHLLSGDNLGSAQRAAETLGITEVHAGVLPAGKLALIQQLQQQGHCVAMVGDGINDAPALAAADLGIAMGGGTDVAMQAAGITLMRSDPRLVPAALEIARRTYQKIRQNLFWAFIYNLVGLPLAACGWLNPMLAGAAMAASSLSVVANALLLKNWKPVTSKLEEAAKKSQ